jgi:long-chain acyl-CoA synthetase
MLTVTENDLPLQRLYHWEHERPDRIFLTQPFDHGKVRNWTWAQAAGEVRRMAAYLQSLNWEPGCRIAILSRNCAWWPMADFAIWMAGHVSVPIYPSLHHDTVRQILEHSESKACFIGATDEKEIASVGVPPGVSCIYFPTASAESPYPDWDSLIDRPPLADNVPRAADDLATIMYTSGTTGKPKGVMHRFSSFAWASKALCQALGLTADTRFFSYLPMAHIVERVGEVLMLHIGAHSYFTEGIETFLEDLHRARPTLFFSVPRLWLKFQQGVFLKIPREKLARLLRVPLVSAFLRRRILHKLGLDSVTRAASGAAPLPPEILLWYRGLGLNMGEGYGMTETMITHVPWPAGVRAGYVGVGVEGVEVRLGPDGELLLKSPMNMMGYYKDSDGTRNAFTDDGFFRTGDLVQLESDGQLKIIGRVKEQFKTSKGKYVAPAPIESMFLSDPMIEGCCIMGVGMPSPFAVVLLTEETRKRCADAEEQRRVEVALVDRMREINASLNPHERVANIVIVDGPWSIENGILTPTMKVRRAVLEARYAAAIDEWRSQDTPVIWESPPAGQGSGYTFAATSGERHKDVPPSQT